MRCSIDTSNETLLYILAPSNRSPLEAFVDLKVSGGDLLEGAGIFFLV